MHSQGGKRFRLHILAFDMINALLQGRKVVRDTAGRLDVDGARDLAGRAVQYVDGCPHILTIQLLTHHHCCSLILRTSGLLCRRLRSQGSSQGRLADVQLHAEASASQDNDVQIPMTRCLYIPAQHMNHSHCIILCRPQPLRMMIS